MKFLGLALPEVESGSLATALFKKAEFTNFSIKPFINYKKIKFNNSENLFPFNFFNLPHLATFASRLFYFLEIWSEMRESNSRTQFGKLAGYHYINFAYLDRSAGIEPATC
jgi:hypothetical protein